MNELTLEEGSFLVRLARASITSFFVSRGILDVRPPYPKLEEKSGAFVTLSTYPEEELRGCIGFPEPIYPLYKAVIRAALAAAFEDPRFPPLSESELNKITVEVSVLTPPERIDTAVDQREDLPELIEVGKHGIIVRRGSLSGLLLPQVAVEYEWDSREFLEHTCIKAGMRTGCWLVNGTEVYRFSAIIFTERSPNGEVLRKELG
ncbi:MAG: TIGR00296 family protein [Candidatus Korarchaeum sp.]